MTISTVHLDRLGYVEEVFHGTRMATLDAGKYPGTLMEVTGPVCPGMRWGGQVFVTPPTRIPVSAVADEKARRSTMFPERLVKQITVLGGDNAMKVSKYLAELHTTAERMMLGDPPRDFKDDRHWPTVPELHDLHVAQRVHEIQSVPSVSGQPISIHVAPVINASAPAAAEARPIVIQQAPAQTVELDQFGLDVRDPLYLHKLALVRSLSELDERGGLPDSVEPQITQAAVRATAARTEEEFNVHKSRVHELLEAA